MYMQETAFSFSEDVGLLFVAENENLKSTVAFFLTNYPVRSLAPLEVEIRRTRVSLRGFLSRRELPRERRKAVVGRLDIM